MKKSIKKHLVLILILFNSTIILSAFSYKDQLPQTLQINETDVVGDPPKSVLYKDKPFLPTFFPENIKQITKPTVYQDGILFTFLGKPFDEIILISSINNWKKEYQLKTNKMGIFFTFIKENIKKGFYTYRYKVNGIWVNDPIQKMSVYNQYQQKLSAIYVKNNITLYQKSPLKIKDNYYRFSLKNNQYKYVSIIGTRNNWDPYAEPMKLKNNQWQIELFLERDKTFYLFWTDGKKINDPFNPHLAQSDQNRLVNFVPWDKSIN